MGTLVKFVQVYGHSDKRVERRLTNIIFSPLEDVVFAKRSDFCEQKQTLIGESLVPI